ncbi:RNA pyrophosphohydrolase [Roseomonas xinghualingensis]|uniref:RNA pyrophosphohydrolase n=1 Tax=Roseomonas xinghualingensis TaxID=2986475 RepID=UPI0021F21EFE|nr:RNA pyrophosphohydrolase [Roseomonas sp. SXEYE001]MCV4208885.1 RNA pyrophosphohydrolase [Roseomonas sp. SXEYE001]
MPLLPLRPNVGACLFNRDGLVLIARRADQPPGEAASGAWQLPQGGLDPGEDPELAVLRELSEEIGTSNAKVMGRMAEWLDYELPAHLIGKALGGRFRGQTQMWFALRFLGDDSEIRLDADAHQEFDSWRWAELSSLPGIAVPFRRPIYERLARDFARYAIPG